MNIAVVAIAKNEELYIEEWFNAYRKIGVNHFYIFDNNDEGNTALAELVKLNQYTDVSLIDVRGPEKLKKYGYQFGCYKMAYDQLSKDYDYMGFFDIDEFLYLNDKTIPDWLAEHKEFDDGSFEFYLKGYIVDIDWSLKDYRYGTSSCDIKDLDVTIIRLLRKKNLKRDNEADEL